MLSFRPKWHTRTFDSTLHRLERHGDKATQNGYSKQGRITCPRYGCFGETETLNFKVTQFFEATNLINSWPIGTYTTHPDDPCYLLPIEVFLGKWKEDEEVLSKSMKTET